jgi:O-antigen/teichoic acid export membrane protein
MVAVVALLAAVAGAVGLSPAMWAGALVFGSAATFAPLALRFAFLGGERMWPVALGLVAGALTFLGLSVGVGRAREQVFRVGGCWALAMIVRAGIPFAAFVGREGRPVIELRNLGPDLVRTAGLGVGGVARGVMGSIDVIVLGILAPPAAVASYGLAAKIPLFLVTLIALFHTALFPSIVRAYAAGAHARLRRVTHLVLDVSLGIALPSAVCLGAVSGALAMPSPRFAKPVR